MIGIYKIENLINGKIYIGQSNNIERRIMEHKQKGEKSGILLDREIQNMGKINSHMKLLKKQSLIS